MREKRNAAKFVSGRRGMLGRTVIQRYSGPLRNSGSTASWEVWEGRLTRDGEEGSIQRASLCYDWVTGQWGVWDGYIFKRFRRTVVLSVCLMSSRWELSKWVFFLVFFASHWECVCAVAGMKRAILAVPQNTLTHIHSFFSCRRLCEFRFGPVACVNNDQHQ